MSDEEKKDNKKQELEPTDIASKIDKTSKQEVITREELVVKSFFEEQMQGVKDRIGDTNFIMGIVIIVLAVGFITLFGVIATLVLDSVHFNSAIYKEYSDKMNTQNQLLEANKQLMQSNRALLKKLEK